MLTPSITTRHVSDLVHNVLEARAATAAVQLSSAPAKPRLVFLMRLREMRRGPGSVLTAPHACFPCCFARSW